MVVQSTYQLSFETRVWRHETNKETNPENIRQSEKAMKKLQNNFTTPEQSKRLLELGVPAWTADLLQETNLGSIWRHRWLKREDESDYDAKAYQDFIDRHEKHTTPCWSVGRLIEIMQICCDRVYVLQPHEADIIQVVIADMCALKDVLDFSKLED